MGSVLHFKQYELFHSLCPRPNHPIIALLPFSTRVITRWGERWMLELPPPRTDENKTSKPDETEFIISVFFLWPPAVLSGPKVHIYHRLFKHGPHYPHRPSVWQCGLRGADQSALNGVVFALHLIGWRRLSRPKKKRIKLNIISITLSWRHQPFGCDTLCWKSS